MRCLNFSKITQSSIICLIVHQNSHRKQYSEISIDTDLGSHSVSPITDGQSCIDPFHWHLSELIKSSIFQSFQEKYLHWNHRQICIDAPKAHRLWLNSILIQNDNWYSSTVFSIIHVGLKSPPALSRWAIGGRWLQSPASQDGDGGKPAFKEGHFWQCYRAWIVAILGMRVGLGYS